MQKKGKKDTEQRKIAKTNKDTRIIECRNLKKKKNNRQNGIEQRNIVYKIKE